MNVELCISLQILLYDILMVACHVPFLSFFHFHLLPAEFSYSLVRWALLPVGEHSFYGEGAWWQVAIPSFLALHVPSCSFILIVLYCFQMHADDFRLDRYGVVSGLRDGGYSDDMTLAAIAGNVLTSSIYKLTRVDWEATCLLMVTGHNFMLTWAVNLFLLFSLLRGSQEAHYITSSCCFSSSPCKWS